MKSKWTKEQIKNYRALKEANMTKREATQAQTIICMVLFVVIIIGLIVKEVLS
jgi:hypothetical protein